MSVKSILVSFSLQWYYGQINCGVINKQSQVSDSRVQIKASEVFRSHGNKVRSLSLYWNLEGVSQKNDMETIYLIQTYLCLVVSITYLEKPEKFILYFLPPQS